MNRILLILAFVMLALQAISGNLYMPNINICSGNTAPPGAHICGGTVGHD